jgi:hypothetical protein
MDQPAPRKPIGSLLQALLSALGLAACGVGAAVMLLAGLLLSNSGQFLMREQAAVFLALAWTLALLAGVALPSLVFASQRIAGRPAQSPSRSGGLRNASLALLLWPPVLAVGSMISGQADLARYLLPPLQIAAVVLPLYWLVELVLNKLPAPSHQRAWGVLNFSIFFSTPLVILAEVFFFVAVIALVVLIISGQPGLQSQFEELSQRILNSASNPQALVRIYQPLLSQPWFIFSVLVGLSGLVPLIEELLKPLAVWAIAGRNLTPAEGFAAGALAGAGFALVETLFSLANPAGSSWLQLTVARAGTGLLHIGTAALMGRALAQAWHSSQYLRAGLTYFSVAAIHGLWNAFSVLSGYADLLEGKTGLLNLLSRLGAIGPYLLGLIAVGMFLAILSTNLRLRASSSPSTPAGGAATS